MVKTVVLNDNMIKYLHILSNKLGVGAKYAKGVLIADCDEPANFNEILLEASNEADNLDAKNNFNPVLFLADMMQDENFDDLMYNKDVFPSVGLCLTSKAFDNLKLTIDKLLLDGKVDASLVLNFNNKLKEYGITL